MDTHLLTRRMIERNEVTQSFSELPTSAAYRPFKRRISRDHLHSVLA